MPDSVFWILTEALKALMTAVDILFHSMQGRDTLITKQTSILQLLIKKLKDDIGMDHLLSGTDLLMVASASKVLHKISTSDGMFTARSGPVQTFVENCGSA